MTDQEKIAIFDAAYAEAAENVPAVCPGCERGEQRYSVSTSENFNSEWELDPNGDWHAAVLQGVTYSTGKHGIPAPSQEQARLILRYRDVPLAKIQAALANYDIASDFSKLPEDDHVLASNCLDAIRSAVAAAPSENFKKLVEALNRAHSSTSGSAYFLRKALALLE